MTGVDDPLLDGNQLSQVTVSVVDASSDPDYGAVADQTVSVTTTDNDAAPTIQLEIDVDPGNKSGLINMNNGGFIAVAILSTASLSAPSQVDVLSLTFGRTGDEESLALLGAKEKPKVAIEDVNGDGRLDLVVYFEKSKTGFLPGNSEGIIRGRLLDGSLFEGRDIITPIFHGKKK